jgi:hypothetical protein
MIIEYFSRVLVMFSWFFLLAAILLIFLFVPSAVFSKYKYGTVKYQFEYIKAAGFIKGEDPIQLIRRVNIMTDILSNKGVSPILMSDIIVKIISLKSRDIKILSISISSDSLTSGKIRVDGIANTRDALTLFDKDLKGDGLFSNVDLPVSNLIKNTDAPFSITLTYNKK